MADNEMKLKIEYDNINKAEKPIQSLVNFFTNNCVLRMLKRENLEEIEITDSEPFNVIIEDDNFGPSDNDEVEIQLFLGDRYSGFNGKCKLTDPTFIDEPDDNSVPESGDESEQEVSVEGYEITDLTVKNGACYIPSEALNAFLANYDKSDYTEIASVKIQLTSKIETKWAANIINDSQLDYGQIGIASIKYENKSEGSNDVALVQEQGANPIIDCDTKFVKTKTELKFYKTSQEAEVSEGAEFSSVEVESIGMGEIPVTITPYYNGKENIDEDIIPKFVDNSTTEDIDESVIQNYTIQKSDLHVDWKLRTTTFTLQSESASYDVFYKVGFCPADRKEETEKEVVESLKLYALMIANNGSSFELVYPEWANYKFNHQIPIVLKPTWFPVYKHMGDSEDAMFAGIMYVELYNSDDGTKFTEEIEEYRAMIKHDSYDVYNFYAPLKDYMLDKGNIPSIYYDMPS